MWSRWRGGRGRARGVARRGRRGGGGVCGRGRCEGPGGASGAGAVGGAEARHRAAAQTAAARLARRGRGTVGCSMARRGPHSHCSIAWTGWLAPCPSLFTIVPNDSCRTPSSVCAAEYLPSDRLLQHSKPELILAFRCRPAALESALSVPTVRRDVERPAAVGCAAYSIELERSNVLCVAVLKRSTMLVPATALLAVFGPKVSSAKRL